MTNAFNEDTTLVTLVEFIAMALEENEIIIEWQTATEFNNAGFYIKRAIWKESDFSNVVRLTEIAPKGDFSVYTY
ncbi:MAG: hypothetical protein ABFS56_19290 [Pseudomonadota bacterium]